MGVCQSCHAETKPERTLCTRCRIRFARLLISLGRDITPMRDSLDATLHPGGHQPNRIQPSTPPTPIRLDVLDMMDLLDSTAHQLWHILDGVEQDHEHSLYGTLLACARHPRLDRFHDAGLYLDTFTRIGRQIDLLLDPPSERQPIGHCTNPLCGVELVAGSRDQWITCPICGTEQRVLTVRLEWLRRLCSDPEKTGSAAEISKVFTVCGIIVRRNTISQWAKRGRIAPAGDGLYRYGDVWRQVELDKQDDCHR